MAHFDETHRRRRRRGFWGKLRNPRTWKVIVQMAYLIYRVIRWLVETFGSPG